MNACSLWDPQLACIDQGKCYCYHIELLSGFSVKSSVISNQAGTIPPITAYPTHAIFSSPNHFGTTVTLTLVYVLLPLTIKIFKYLLIYFFMGWKFKTEFYIKKTKQKS